MPANASARNEQQIPARLWRFGDCEFEELSLQLRMNGRPVELELKPLEFLQQLLLHAGEVVSKEVLLDAVWPGLNVVDGSLATAISKLRKALGDENLILTIPRVGYRLAVAVQAVEVPAPPQRTQIELEPGASVPGREHWRLTQSSALGDLRQQLAALAACFDQVRQNLCGNPQAF